MCVEIDFLTKNNQNFTGVRQGVHMSNTLVLQFDNILLTYFEALTYLIVFPFKINTGKW